MVKKQKKYKMKTHKATSKRFRYTGSGKLVRTKGGKSHLRRRRSKRARRMLDQTIVVESAKDRQRVQRLAPYLKKYKSNPPA